MTAEIINLRRARKQKARAEAGARAEENRVRFGLSKPEKLHLKQERKRLDDHLDGHRRDPAPKT